MTDNKKSALEQLKSLYPAQLLNDDGSVKCELGPSIMVNAILELAEKVELIIETQTAAKNNQLTFAQVTEMLEPIVKKLEALEAKQPKEPSSFHKACIESIMQDAGTKQQARFEQTKEFAATYSVGQPYGDGVIRHVDYQKRLIQLVGSTEWISPETNDGPKVEHVWSPDRAYHET